MTELLPADDRALLPGAHVDDAFTKYFGTAPQVDEGAPSSVAPRLQAAAPRARTFAAHLDGREEGAQQTRRQAMRRAHGWSAFRPHWWNQQSRDYKTAYKAEKLRYQGFAKLANQQAELNAAAGKQPDPQAGAPDGARGGMAADRELVGKYSTMKSELKNAAGWKRFLPFSSTRKYYKAARQELRTASMFAEDNKVRGFAKFASKMPSIQAKMAQQEAHAARDGDLKEVLGLLDGAHVEPEQGKPGTAEDHEGSDASSHFSYGGQLAAKPRNSDMSSHESGDQAGIEDVIAANADQPNFKALEGMLAFFLQNPEVQGAAHQSGTLAPEDEGSS
jgi:hypothetical protein